MAVAFFPSDISLNKTLPPIQTEAVGRQTESVQVDMFGLNPTTSASFPIASVPTEFSRPTAQGVLHRCHFPNLGGGNIRHDLAEKAEVIDEIEIRRAGTAVGSDRDVDAGGQHVAPAVGRVGKETVRAQGNRRRWLCRREGDWNRGGGRSPANTGTVGLCYQPETPFDNIESAREYVNQLLAATREAQGRNRNRDPSRHRPGTGYAASRLCNW